MKVTNLYVGFVLFMTAVLLAWGSGALAAEQGDTAQQLQEASAVLNKIGASPQTIPPELLNESRGIAVFPKVIRAAAIIGGEHGEGAFMQKQDGEWSPPLLVSLTGGSLGAQLGAETSDFILLFRTQNAIDKLLRGKFTAGADLSVTAGPVGSVQARSYGAERPIDNADILTYKIDNKGLLASASIEGAVISVMQKENGELYGQPNVAASQILQGENVEVPPLAKNFQNSVKRYIATASAGATGEQELTVTGKLERADSGWVLESEQGRYQISGKEVANLQGKTVRVTGTVSESEGQKIIHVRSIRESE
ncbi:MAG: YSC84-related protein [bacterium]